MVVATDALKLERLAASFLAKLWFRPAFLRSKVPSDSFVKRLEAPEWVCDLERVKHSRLLLRRLLVIIVNGDIIIVGVSDLEMAWFLVMFFIYSILNIISVYHPSIIH